METFHLIWIMMKVADYRWDVEQNFLIISQSLMQILQIWIAK